MSDTEDRLRAALADYDAAAPGLPAVAAGIQAGICRRRRQRRWAAIGTTLATVAAIAVTVPLHLGVDRDQAPGHPTRAAAVRPATTLDRPIDFAPTWLPAGATETERVVNEASTATARVFTAGQWIKVANSPARADLTNRSYEKVSVDGQIAIGLPAADGYELQLPWRAGRWLTVTIRKSSTARSEAMRIAGSVRTIAPMSFTIPVSCSTQVCTGPRIASIYGGPKAWQATVDQGSVHFVLSNNYSSPVAPDWRWTHVVHGDPAQLAKGRLTIDLGAGRQLTVSSRDNHQLTDDQLLAAANSAWPITSPAYSWLATRP